MLLNKLLNLSKVVESFILKAKLPSLSSLLKLSTTRTIYRKILNALPRILDYKSTRKTRWSILSLLLIYYARSFTYLDSASRVSEIPL